jgi:small-conductance mechanosensitive channel
VALAALGRAGRSRLVEPRTVPVLELGWKIAAIGIGSWALLILWGVDPTAWLASAGIVGIAVGFAAKDTLANLFSGLFIVADAPYKIGDYVVLDSGERGMVTRVGLRSTRLLTRDDVEVTVPNAVMGNVKIVNESGGPYEKTRIRIQIGVAYGSDVDQVCEILENTALSHPAVSGEPAPRVRMRAFGGSSLDFELLCWIERPEHRGQLTHDLLMAVYKAFLAAGIEIPYSKHDIYVKELPASGPRAGPATEA